MINTLIREEDIQLIHSHHRWNCLVGSLCANLNSIASITSDHNILYGRKSFSFWSDGVITDSHFNEEHLINYFKVPKDTIVVIPPLIEKERFSRLLEQKSENNTESNEFLKFKDKNSFLIGQISRLSEEKGHEFLIDAIYGILKKNKVVKVLIAGEGDLRKKLTDKLETYGLADNVLFLGEVTDIVNFLSVLDLFIISSSEEGFCLAATEAILYGLPVIATNVGGLPEQVINNETGFIVDYGDKISLEKHITYLLSNGEARKTMGRRGREHLLSMYSPDNISKKLEEAYEYFQKKCQK